MGQLSVLECAFWGFLLLLALFHLFPQLRLFVATVLGLERLRFRLFRPSAPALRYLSLIKGAGGLPRRFGFSCVCAAQVPVAPTVGAMLPCLWLVDWWHRVQRPGLN